MQDKLPDPHGLMYLVLWSLALPPLQSSMAGDNGTDMVTKCFLVLYDIQNFCIVVILILLIHAVRTDLIFFFLCLNHTVNWGSTVIFKNGYDSIAAKACSPFALWWKAIEESLCNRLLTLIKCFSTSILIISHCQRNKFFLSSRGEMLWMTSTREIIQ